MCCRRVKCVQSWVMWKMLCAADILFVFFPFVHAP
uniref:Uncharacterized protein n=1 Tax=Zea mays TaxID=4577 RepID=B4FYM7_MAIZE|nr:unknown [Zea mays]